MSQASLKLRMNRSQRMSPLSQRKIADDQMHVFGRILAKEAITQAMASVMPLNGE